MLTFKQLVDADMPREQLEQWCRERAMALPVNEEWILCRVLGKYRMLGRADDIALMPHLALDGIWEPWVTMAITRHVRSGMHCLDVGACYGYYSVLLADLVGSDGTVEAWEPWHGAVLEANVALNGASVRVRRSPMGKGTYWAQEPERSSLGFINAGCVHLDTRKTGRGPLQGAVPVTQPVDFIKVDVEGSEGDVWEALEPVIEASPVLTVCLEFAPSRHAQPTAFLLGLKNRGFALGTVGEDGTPRACNLEEALVPDTGGMRMLWLTKKS